MGEGTPEAEGKRAPLGIPTATGRKVWEAATARTLELVAEWWGDLAEHAALAESAEERRQAAIALRSTAFAAWLEDRS